MAGDAIAGRYRLEQRLSTTPMSEVWTATDPVLARRVVVKLLAADADRARFEREARAAAGLAHPNVVQLFDYGEDHGRPYMVLEHLPGGTLAERLPEGRRLPDDETRRVATDVAAGLAHAHAHGVVHRDLKPANVLFDADARGKVGDFGIAHVQGLDTLSDTGTVLGTALSMAPEQVAGEESTPAADVYAFGVLLYRLLTGRYPFESPEPLEIARLHRDAEPPPLESIRADAPPELAALATAALAKDPAARPADGAALLSALGEPGPTVAVTDAPTRLIAVPPRRRRLPRRELAFALVALLLVAAGVLAAIALTGSHSSAPAVRTSGHSTRSTSTRSTTQSTVPVIQPTTSHATTTPKPKPLPVTTVPAPAPPPSTTLPTTAPGTTTTAPPTTT